MHGLRARLAADAAEERDAHAVSIDDHVGYCNECGAEYRGVGGLCPSCAEMFACIAIVSRASIDTRWSLDGVREVVESLIKVVALLVGEDVASLMWGRVH